MSKFAMNIRGAHFQTGFTLIEMMITVAIIGILASVAYPSYLEHVESTKRGEGGAELLILASQQERHYTVDGEYATAAELGANGDGNIVSENGYYNLTSVYGTNGDGDDQVDVPSTYTLTATPVGWSDDDCGSLTLTNTGQRGAKVGDAELAAAAAAECWR